MAIGTFTFNNPNNPLSWVTIDKGMQRLPNAFLPLIRKEKVKLRYNSEVYKLEKTDGGEKIKVHWKTNGKEKSEVFDRVIVTPPLGVVRHWDLPRKLLFIAFLFFFSLFFKFAYHCICFLVKNRNDDLINDSF